MRDLLPPRPMYVFDARFYGDSPAYDEFDSFLRLEFTKRPPGWAPAFGRVTRFDRDVRHWDHGYLLSGKVPGAASKTEAQKKARRRVSGLTRSFRVAHSNPGNTLPEPVITVLEVVAP